MTPVRALLSWLVLLAVAFLNGALRQEAYPDSLGDFAARQVSTGIGAVALGAAIWLLLLRWPTARPRHAWAVGALWAALTVLFEVGLVRASGRPWSDVAGQYAIWKGSLWPLLVVWVLAAPAALSALRRSGIAVGEALGCAVAGWAACGLVFLGSRAASGVEAAVVVHLVAAPAIGAAVAALMWRNPRHPGVAATALMTAGIPAFLDAVVVAPFMERSYAMFASAAGTWIPLALLLAGSAATAGLRARRLSAPL